MKQVILLSLFLCFQKNLLAQQDTLYVFDAYADKYLVVEKNGELLVSILKDI